MILDKLENIDTYSNLHPLFKKVFEMIRKTDMSQLIPGHVDFSGETFYMNVDEVALRSEKEACLEVHNKYIDIQIPIKKSERMGYLSRKECGKIRTQNEERDYILYDDAPSSYFKVSPGDFVIFFPQDAHAPIIGVGMTKKIVIKVPVI
ncbi:MAG TPA: YhcH/YjgK/YiaL family protein [Paludibacteraceae bacterium]|nr:YhcH/YjgK/YiaL family protein [Paludibacteraceae bacterium]HPH62872.1 YhcH/YjgK/YiaL family protein [Paludibacteraceae bacterium]